MASKVSLLHATYFRPGGPLPLRDAWLAAASKPFLVEYVVAMDDDDAVAIAATKDCVRVISPASDTVTAVRNWNAAAQIAQGELLAVIADDLFPPPGWDDRLRETLNGRCPQRTPFAIKVCDSGDPTDTLMRHPVVSRAFYEVLGLFHEDFTGVFCDNDITQTAYWRAFIIDGRQIEFDHRHPELGCEAPPTPSQQRINTHDEYTRGSRILAERWPKWRRGLSVELVAPHASSRPVLLRRRLGIVRHVLRGAARRARRHLNRESSMGAA